MRKYPEKNKVGLFRKLRTDDWLINHYSGGKPYLDGNIIVQSTVVKPIYSYGHNYNKFNNDFSLFMWTTESDIAKVQAFFESVVEDMKPGDLEIGVSDRFAYLNKIYGENK